MVAVYLRPRGVAVGQTNVHDAGSWIAVGVIFSGVRLFFVNRLLKAATSATICFQAFAVVVNSLQPVSHVSTSALVGAISIPFCVSGPRTVLKIPLIALNVSVLPGTRAGAPKPPPPPPPRPAGAAPPIVANFASSAVAAVATSGGNEPVISAASWA